MPTALPRPLTCGRVLQGANALCFHPAGSTGFQHLNKERGPEGVRWPAVNGACEHRRKAVLYSGHGIKAPVMPAAWPGVSVLS